MALYSVVFLGSTPIGAPLVGWLAEVAGPRSGLVLGGIAALVTAAGAAVAYRAPTWRCRRRARCIAPRSPPATAPAGGSAAPPRRARAADEPAPTLTRS